MQKTNNYSIATSNFDKILAVFGTSRVIAKICRCTEQNVSIWKSIGCIPANHVPPLYQAAKGRLSLGELRSDFAFN